jgi:plasmid maintenance system antidote protein VapI
MKQRIAEIIERENLTSAKFATLIGIQPSAVSHILSGRNNASLDVAQKILNTFRTINPDWLILGVGNMYRESHKSTDKQNIESNNPLFKPQMPSLFPENPTSHTEYLKENKLNHIEKNPDLKPKPESQNISGPFTEKKEIPQVTPVQEKKIRNIIIYYTDNTFEEFKAQV